MTLKYQCVSLKRPIWFLGQEGRCYPTLAYPTLYPIRYTIPTYPALPNPTQAYPNLPYPIPTPSLPYPNPRGSVVEHPGHGFESRPRHTKGDKMVPVATLFGAQYYKASTGFSSNKYHTTNNATLTKNKKSEKSPIIINVYIHRRTVW